MRVRFGLTLWYAESQRPEDIPILACGTSVKLVFDGEEMEKVLIF